MSIKNINLLPLAGHIIKKLDEFGYVDITHSTSDGLVLEYHGPTITSLDIIGYHFNLHEASGLVLQHGNCAQHLLQPRYQHPIAWLKFWDLFTTIRMEALS
jgi:hypothetical protein